MDSLPFRPICDDDEEQVSTAGSPTTPPASDITPELLTTAQAAKLLGIGTRTLWRWSRSGICPSPVKIGRGLRAAVRYRRAELLQWIADGCPRVERGQR
jgi:predicted DNA-binding transcriptional regulator AlpA